MEPLGRRTETTRAATAVRDGTSDGVGEATSNGVGAAPAMSNDIGVRALGRCVSGDGGWSQTRGKGGDEAVRRGGGVREVVAGRGGGVGGWHGGVGPPSAPIQNREGGGGRRGVGIVGSGDWGG
nr:rRNA 2'-O-methyltransferase fibrillarin-like [Aegilops tauschii subsp. strangulata]